MTAQPVSSAAGLHDFSPDAWVLRVGTAACFFGHGTLGLLRTAAWTSYFAVAGIGREGALTLMPLIGALDVAMGVLVLLKPIRAIVLYMVAWCVWTALLRPLAGESVWEAVERAGSPIWVVVEHGGSYAAPLALALLLPAQRKAQTDFIPSPQSQPEAPAPD